MNELESLLWEQQCVQVAPKGKPFTYSSGQKGYFYCDCRKLMTRSFVRKQVTQLLLSLLEKSPISNQSYETVAAVATSGIPWGILLAEELQKNFIYVRSKAKDYGLDKMIEGEIEAGHKVLVIEDVINRGTSIHHVLQYLKKSDLSSVLVVSLLHYEKVHSGSFLGNPPIVSLSTVQSVIDCGVRQGHITFEQGQLAREEGPPLSYTGLIENQTFF